jgi:hypothetical protein
MGCPMQKKICEKLLNTQVSNIESFFMPRLPSYIVMTFSSLTHHLNDTIFHFYDMFTACARSHKHNCKKEMGNYQTQSCLPRNISNVGPQKALNVVAIWLSSHGSFEAMTQIHNTHIFSHSSFL